MNRKLVRVYNAKTDIRIGDRWRFADGYIDYADPLPWQIWMIDLYTADYRVVDRPTEIVPARWVKTVREEYIDMYHPEHGHYTERTRVESPSWELDRFKVKVIVPIWEHVGEGRKNLVSIRDLYPDTKLLEMAGVTGPIVYGDRDIGIDLSFLDVPADLLPATVEVFKTGSSARAAYAEIARRREKEIGEYERKKAIEIASKKANLPRVQALVDRAVAAPASAWERYGHRRPTETPTVTVNAFAEYVAGPLGTIDDGKLDILGRIAAEPRTATGKPRPIVRR